MSVTLPCCSVQTGCCRQSCVFCVVIHCSLDGRHDSLIFTIPPLTVLCSLVLKLLWAAFQLQRSVAACIYSLNCFIINKYWLRSKAFYLFHPLKITRAHTHSHTGAHTSSSRAVNFTIFIPRNENPRVQLWCCQMWRKICMSAFPKPNAWVSSKEHVGRVSQKREGQGGGSGGLISLRFGMPSHELNMQSGMQTEPDKFGVSTLLKPSQ